MKTNPFHGKKVLVTGGAGFFASHLVKSLHQSGAVLSVVVKYNSVFDNIRLSALWPHLTIIEADLRNLDSLRQLRDQSYDFVFHFAAYNHVGDSFRNFNESIQSNLTGSMNLLEGLGDFGKFIYISTSEVYGFQENVPFTETMTPFPTSPYAVGKYGGELYARMIQHVYKKPVLVIRPFNCYGPYQSAKAIIPEIIIKCLLQQDVLATDGIQTRDFNFVEDLVSGVLSAAASEYHGGEVINIGSGEEITIRDLVETIHRISGSRSKLQFGAIPYRPTEIWRMRADNSSARELLGWGPKVTLEEGLERTIAWYRRYLEVFHDPSSPLNEL
jgi:nucleoside-diphosphate-sugar epimerase